MEIVKFDPEAVTSLQVVDEIGVGLVGFGLVGLGEVHEVGTVWEDVQTLFVGMVFGKGVEGIAGCGVEWRGGPFSLGFEEEGEGVAADMDCVGDGVLDTWM